MALALSIPTEFGVTATYHKLASLAANWADGMCLVTLYSYLDAGARQDGAKPLGTVQVALPALLQGADALDRAALYAAVKLQPDWTAAVDA